jgi:hypothetical protein
LKRHLAAHGKPPPPPKTPGPKAPCRYCGKIYAKTAISRHIFPKDGSGKPCPKRPADLVRRQPSTWIDIEDADTPSAMV